MKLLRTSGSCANGHPITETSLMKNGRCKPCMFDKKRRFFLKRGDILPATTEASYVNYKEPLQPVDSGYGYLGTVAMNKEKTHMQCHLCGLFFKNVGSHAKWEHGISSKAYKLKFQLAMKTPLVADVTRAKFIAANLKVDPEIKARRLAHFRKVRAKGVNYNTTNSTRMSLEQKNKEGRCPDQLVDKINQLAKKLNKVPARRDFEAEYGTGFSNTILLTFGSWNSALIVAGHQPSPVGGFRTAGYTYDQVVELAKEFMNVEGRPPRSYDQGKGIIPSKSVIRRLFGGSIIELRRAAGMEEYDYVNENGAKEMELLV